MFLYLLIGLVSGVLHQYLHGTPALDNQCSNQNNIGQNYFVGDKYFYNYITLGGSQVDFSKLTFILWIKFVDNNPYKQTGRQIIFQLVDGSDDNPYVNMQLSVFPSNGYLQLALYNGDIQTSQKPQYQMNLSNVANAKQLLGWNQIVISIDQSMPTSYLNMKLYDSFKNTNYQLQVPNINGTIFTYRISQQTRITNEALLGQYKIDTRACAYIANFQYYIGWTTMDTEPVLDYYSQQVFYLQPNGISLDSVINQIQLKTQSGAFYDSTNKSLHVFKSTRLEYSFKQQMDSYIMAFWINPNIITKGNINPNYQLFSLTDDSLLNTAIGLGINNQLQLLMYQRYNTKQLTQLGVGWTHIIAYFMQNSWSNDFVPQSSKLMTIYVNGLNVTQIQVDNIFQWTRLVIGFLFRDVQDINYVQMKEIQIYQGMSLQKSQYGCLIKSNNDCILCDPNNSQFTHTAGLCPQKTQSNYQSCQTGTTACNITISQGIVKYYSVLCQDQYVYNSPTCIKGSAFPCGLSMNKGCADCQVGTLKTLSKGATRCIPECVSVNDGLYNFDDNGVCKQVCPYYATYQFDCQMNVTVVQCYNQCPSGYVVVNNGICQHPDYAPIKSKQNYNLIKGLITNYTYYTPSSNQKDYATLKNAQILFPDRYFDSQTTYLQYFKGCQKIPFFFVQQNVTQLCIYPCGLCYSTTKTSCLTCQDPNQFLDRQFTSCVKSCDQSVGILKLNHRLTMTCEQQCPQGFYQQDIECVASCSQNYYLFNGICTQTIPQGYYINNNIPKPCPQVCKTCSSTLICLSCIGNYPMNGNMCVTKCPFFLDSKTNTCVSQCQSSDLIYQTSNLNGFAFKVCFKNQCGAVQANKLIQTVQHQTNALQCAQPCDDGYYADYGVLKCIKCKSPCLTCQDTQDYCVSCIQNYFFYLNSCFDNCPDMYEDTINQMCVGGCDQGYTLSMNGVKGCVLYCDDNKYGLVAYYYKLTCLETPNIGTYCTGQYCFDCDSSCYTCNGPNSNQCLSCNNLYFYNNMCNTDCPSNLYSISTTWTCQASCPVGTFTMDGQKGCYNPCPSKTYQYNNKCYLNQQQSTYCNLVQQTYICSDCYLTCQSCTDKASNKCTTCNAGFYFWQGQCLTKCPKSTYRYNFQCYNQCPNGLKMQEDTCVTSCDSGYITFSNYCGLTCPDGSYKVLIFCVPCFEGCATCASGDQNQCQSCASGYYLQGQSCQSTCPADHPYRNQISNTCDLQCPDTGFINVQTDATYCVSKCSAYYYGRLCQAQCPNQTWANGNECRVCDKNCTICFGDLVSQCSSCSTGNYLDQQTCVEQCPSQRPFANQVDKKCLSNCPTYTYLESMYCFSSCPSYLYNYELNPGNFECVKQCYPSSYVSGQYCLACAPQCIQCYESNQFSCLKCQPGFYLSITTCQLTCPTFYDEVNQACVPSCNPSQYYLDNKCLSSCPPNYLNYMMQCVVSCPPVTYKNNTSCLPCHYSCLECQDGTNQQCSRCISNYFINGKICTLSCPFLYDYINYKCVNGCPDGSFIFENQCVSSCPIGYLKIQDQFSCVKQCTIGYYQDGLQCLKCDSICTQCTAIDRCQACAENYALNIDKCVSICWQNDKLFYDNVNRLCQSQCPNYHYSAYGKYICVDKCDQYYSGQFCVDQCQSGYYGNDQNVCTLCPTNCIECTAIDNCTSCETNFVLTKGQCSTICISQYLDVTHHQCVDACPINTYLLIDQCLVSCPSPQYFAYNFVCYQQCPLATFRQEYYCLDCSPECTKCVGPTSSDCEQCSKGYYLDNQICTKTCPLNYYYDQSQFVCTLKCDKNLFELDDKCLEVCPILSYYEQCVDQCPPHTYQYNLMCQDCKSICLTCNQYECLTCVAGYFLNNGVCDQVCPNLYDQVNSKCVDQCDSSLLKFINSCLETCPNLPTYSYQQECLIQCPDSTTIVGETCQQCQERCLVCQNQSVCLQCQDGYNLLNGVCLVACPMASPYLENGICGTKCSDTTFYYENNCVIECPNKQYLQQCVDECPEGYYGDVCSPCKSQCKTCSSYQTCNSCNPNYFLTETICDTQCPFIYDTIKWQCTDICEGLLNGLFCISSCPTGLVQQGNLCQSTCDDGYYNENDICAQCPRECQLCTSALSCQSCSISYFLLNQSCLSTCPVGLFSDPKSNKCVLECPNNMIKYQTQCLFSCPKGYVANKSECTQECSHNQLQIGQICLDCPLECDGCTGLTNYDCIQCSQNSVKQQNLCISTSCISGYTLVNGFCLKCQFNCLTCDQNTCLTCRGDRTTKLCACNKGYYDDGLSDQCQKCPCDECTSINSCTKCKNNLKTPNCSCDRQLNYDWCIDCNVGRTTIKFSYDLNSIIVDFGYLISVNLINPFQPSTCEYWIVNFEILGIGSLCHLVWDRTQVIIQLGQQANVTIGDKLEFKQNFYKDVNDQECIGFLNSFIDSSVKQPDLLIKPYVEFDNPYLISNCKEIKIKQISIWGTGQRELQILQWKIINEQDLEEDHLYQMSDYLQQMGNYLEFDINVLQQNQTYIIQAKYINILKKLNTTILTFKTNLEQKPYVYLTFNPLTAHAYIFDCKTFQDLQLTYTLSILIQKQNHTLLTENILVVNTYSIIVDESKLPRGEVLLVTAQIDEIIIKQNVTLQFLPHLLKFKEQSRFLGLEGRITARGYDQNINDKIISQMNFKYQWVCTNLHNLEPCKSQQNQIIKFVDTRILQIQIDSPNITFAFYCNASKGNRWTVEVQKIVITNLNIQNNYVENIGNSIGNINPNDDVFIILKQPQQYAMIMYQYLLIGTIKLNGLGLRFKLANYLNESYGDVTIYLLPSNDSLKYTINFVQMHGQLEIDPKEGFSLDQFTITMNITNLDQLDIPLKYGFFQYLKQSLLEDDVANYQTVNGIPLGKFQITNSIQARLNHGIDSVYILCQVIDIKGFVVFFNQSILVKRRYYTQQQNINALPKQNQTLQQINAALLMLKEESKQVCLKQCSGVGTCIQGRCYCPPGFYFDDCSGSKADSEVQQQYISTTLDQLFNQSIEGDEQYKLFIKSLSYLSTYQESFDLFNQEKALVQLGIVSESLSNRINKLNSLTINLQLNQINSLEYDSLDIGQIVQMEDLMQTMQCHDLIWYILLQNKTGNQKYQIQFQTRQIIQQIIQLSFYILKPDDSVDFSGAGVTLLINRSNQSVIQTTQGRMLSTSNQYYDIVQAKYLSNLYQEDGYFPYPKQKYPLYDYSLRLAGRQSNIQLQYKINYTFEVGSQNRYICIMRNSTNFGWEWQNCNSTYANKTIYCNCSLLAPTTIVDDQDYLVFGNGEKRIQLPNFIILVLFVQTFLWVCLLIIGLRQDRQILNSQIVHNQQTSIKYGVVRALNKTVRKSLNLDGIHIEPTTPELSHDQDHFHFHDHEHDHFHHIIHNTDHDDELLGHQDQQKNGLISNNRNVSQKYSLENFQKQHSILNIIYKYKKFQPRWFRSTLILMRWTICIALSGLFAYLQLLYEVSVYPTLGAFLFSRMIETFITQQFKQTSYIDSIVLKLVYITFIFVIIFSSLFGFWLIYTQLDNQTDWIISYLLSFAIDILLLDLISLIANKYLGEDLKIRLRKQIKRIKKQHEMQKQVKSQQNY